MIRQRDLWKAVLIARGHEPTLHTEGHNGYSSASIWYASDVEHPCRCKLCHNVFWLWQDKPEDVKPCKGVKDAV